MTSPTEKSADWIHFHCTLPSPTVDVRLAPQCLTRITEPRRGSTDCWTELWPIKWRVCAINHLPSEYCLYRGAGLALQAPHQLSKRYSLHCLCWRNVAVILPIIPNIYSTVVKLVYGVWHSTHIAKYTVNVDYPNSSFRSISKTDSPILTISRGPLPRKHCFHDNEDMKVRRRPYFHVILKTYTRER